MTTTAVSRVVDYVAARKTKLHLRPDLIASEITQTETKYRSQRVAELLASDLDALLKILAELCEDHGSCECCGTWLCETCGLGESGCSHGDSLCIDCATDICRECANDARDDARAEAYADAHGLRY